MPTVKFIKEKKEITVAQGANLRTEALNAGVNLYNGVNGYGVALNKIFNCKGLGHCGTCRVLIKKGTDKVSPMGMMEKANFTLNPPALMAYIGNEANMRLACCTNVQGDIEVETGPDMNLFGENFFS